MNTDRADLIDHMLSEIGPAYEANRLRGWFREFYESVSEQFHENGTLTDKQLHWLTKIYEMATR